MKRIVLLTVIVGFFLVANAGAAPWPTDIIGGYNPYTTPTFWYLLDYYGYQLEDGDCVAAYWVGMDSLYAGVDPNNPPYPLGDDVYLDTTRIAYGGFFFGVTTWGVGEGHPALNESIYVAIFDGPFDSLTQTNYYGLSNRYAVQNYLGDVFYALFPGDPGYGHTDTQLPVELVSFTATGRDGEVLLEWVTASEIDVHGFHIERDGGRITNEVVRAVGNSTVENTYTYVDKGLTNRVTYSYNLIVVDIDGLEQVANLNPVLATPLANVPGQSALHQNYPNPFNPATEIKYDLAEDVPVTLKIYNILGAEVATMVDGHQKAGYYTINWNAEEMASGIYFCALTAGDFKDVKKMVFLK
jgi:hypothetical protein